jgi:hypothetical protein
MTCAPAPWDTFNPPNPTLNRFVPPIVTGVVESEVKLRLRTEKSAPRTLVRFAGFGDGLK